MSEIETVSYDQFVDIPSLGDKSKIIFSEQVYNYLNGLISETISENAEKGCYIVGRKLLAAKDTMYFYFDFCSSKFQTTNGVFKNGGVISTDNNKMELINELKKYSTADIKPCIMHFHTHNYNGIFSALSDRDYGVYATMGYQLKGCEIFGMLAAPNKVLKNNTFELSGIYCFEPKLVGSRACANFYTIPNIFYCVGNQVFKVATFPKQGLSQKTGVTELGRSDKFVQNSKELPGSRVVSGIGINPVNNSLLSDDHVGYVDANGSLCFPSENLTLQVSIIRPTNTSGFRK